MWLLSVCSVSFCEIPFPDGSLAVPSCPCFRAVLVLPSPGTAPFQLSVFTLGLQAFVFPSFCNVFPQMFRWFGPSLYSGLSPRVSCSKRSFPAYSSLDLPSLPHHPSLAIVITALTVLTLNFVLVYCLHHQGGGTLPYS